MQSLLFCCSTKTVLYGLRTYKNDTLQGAHRAKCLVAYASKYALFSLLKFDADFYIHPEIRNVSKQLSLPKRFDFKPNETGEVIGWSLESNGALEMKIISNVDIIDALSNKNESFCVKCYKIDLGSPLIADNVVYGFFANRTESFRSITPYLLAWFKQIIFES